MNFDDNKVKYLEMIQSIITRMASNSFMLKGWAITLVAGTFALLTRDSERLFFLIAYIPIILFWFLDSYYLQLERKYRELYNNSIQLPPDSIDFNLKITKKCNWQKKTYYFQSLFSITEFWFYFPSAILISIVIALTLC